jgi:hypothetical protein
MTETTPVAAEQTGQTRTPETASSPGLSAPKRYPPGGFNTLYWCYFGLSLGGMLLTITIILAIFGLPVMIGAAVCAAIFLYRAWDQVQDGEARATPGLAVGLMFVPLFNLYWAYIAIWGLSKNMNSYTRRNNIEAPAVNETLALGLCVLMSVGLVFMFVPYLNIIAWLITIPTSLIVMNDFRRTSVAIAASGA